MFLSPNGQSVRREKRSARVATATVSSVAVDSASARSSKPIKRALLAACERFLMASRYSARQWRHGDAGLCEAPRH
ncbi:Hypothetical protein BN69_2327 [Methylocystis sp. SC2]|nr:Hypothetical protein BN69_2327 [Methylocystis sp. SC2]